MGALVTEVPPGPSGTLPKGATEYAEIDLVGEGDGMLMSTALRERSYSRVVGPASYHLGYRMVQDFCGLVKLCLGGGEGRDEPEYGAFAADT